MGRYKLGPQGGYYDPNDSGPDQFTPTPGQQYPGMPAPQQAQPSPGGYQPPIDFPQFPRTPPGPSPNGPWDRAGDNGWDGTQTPKEVGGPGPMPWSEAMPDGSGGSYNPGGHVDANGNPLPGPPPMDTSGWPRKQYPGGVGGPVPPWMTLGSLGQGLDQSPKVYGDGMAPSGDLSGSKSIWSSLGSIGNTFGVNGGNVQPKTGMLGPIVNQFKR